MQPPMLRRLWSMWLCLWQRASSPTVESSDPPLLEDGPPRSPVDAMDDDRGVQLSQSERLHMQQVRELDAEELEVEEVGSDMDVDRSDDSSVDGRGDGGAGPRRGGFTFNADISSLVSRHTYLGDVNDVSSAGARHCADSGSTLTLPMFYLEGIVLFPEDTLPLRVLQPRFRAAVERALQQTNAPSTLGVVHVSSRQRCNSSPLALVGTTAEIRQIRHLSDGTINVVTRGRQRFRVNKAWIDADGTPYAEVRIIDEFKPLHIPRDAFGVLACTPSTQSGKVPRTCQDWRHEMDSDRGELDSDRVTDGSYLDTSEEESSGEESDEDHPAGRKVGARFGRSEAGQVSDRDPENGSALDMRSNRKRDGWGGVCRAWAVDESRWQLRAQRTSWPHWVYRMYDAYDLARRAMDMWRQMIDQPWTADGNITPELVSFYIASNMPVQDSTKQELLQTDNLVYRLRREIQLLESLERLCCKSCKAAIAKRSDMLVMSTEGPISAFVNEHGYVFEALTLTRARGLMLHGRPETAHSWFPGYSWTIAQCANCQLHMGWFFCAVKGNTRPRTFWGIRRSQLAEDCKDRK